MKFDWNALEFGTIDSSVMVEFPFRLFLNRNASLSNPKTFFRNVKLFF